MKRVVKELVKTPLRRAGAALGRHRWPVLSGSRLLILTYHRVLPPDHPEWKREQPGMIVTPDTLAMHCRVLRQYFEVVHLGDWLKRRADSNLGQARCCAITFDDGWKDSYEYAHPVLTDAGAPATFFLVTGQVGTSYQFWPNRMARLLANGPAERARKLLKDLKDAGVETAHVPAEPTIDDIDRLIGASKALPDAVVAGLLVDESVHEDRDLMNWEEVREMAASGLAQFGSHTANHTRLLPGLSDAVVREEIIASKETLEEHLDQACELFCYPNGDISNMGLELVRGHYAGAVTTDRGWNIDRTDAHLLRRIGLHEDIANTPVKFLSRIGGLV